LQVTLVQEVDVPWGRKGRTGTQSRELPLKPVKGKGQVEVPFAAPVEGMLTGSAYVQAALLPTQGDVAISTGRSESVSVGVRRRMDLAGDWQVTDVKVLEGDVPWRPKDWKMKPPPAAVKLPGPLPFETAFRGWVTLKREVSWPKLDDLRPCAVRIFGASDSALVRVNGSQVGETASSDEIAVLTHWFEFHSPNEFKGEQNEQKRLLLIASGTEHPVTMPLAKALLAPGKAEIEMVIRGTSGGLWSTPIIPYGILNDFSLELAPAVRIRSVTFDTSKPGDQRRFSFRLALSNETGERFTGQVRAVYGEYAGDFPYTGLCAAVATADQPVTLPPGESTVEVLRDETPRFATCRATFLLLGRGDRLLDAAEQDYHPVTVEIRNRRDLYLNNERFIFKGQGSWATDPSNRFQMKIKGGNGFRGHSSSPSRYVPGFTSEAEFINERLKHGLLTSAGGALLASCEKCTFWNPKDTSNIEKAVRTITRKLAQCPGITDWEATNELHGEPPEARVAILNAFHKYDPYHRPVLATKGSGEWEAEAHEGKVDGVDIVGCQYLLSKEAIDSVTAAITEQPIMSTEVNFFDGNLYNEQRVFEVWLNKGLCGSLLFDYSGGGLSQPVPMLPPEAYDRGFAERYLSEPLRTLYHDLVASAARQADGQIAITVGNRMPYTLRKPALMVRSCGQMDLQDLEPGDTVSVLLPLGRAGLVQNRAVIRAEYTTHCGLKHFVILTPQVSDAPKGGK
jgi:hypothetical protein